MTIEQYNKAKDIERKIKNLNSIIELINTEDTSITVYRFSYGFEEKDEYDKSYFYFDTDLCNTHFAYPYDFSKEEDVKQCKLDLQNFINKKIKILENKLKKL